ncbi:MAG: HAD-IB family hydrolase [Burkholderiales bacterium]|nr:HAD-IB family hydrolase [Burkholderiales bacterium]
MDLVLFDLDNTLLAGDSDYAWAEFLIEQGVLDRGHYESRNDEFFRQYKAGTLDIRQFLAFQLAPLAAHDRAQLDRWHAQFMAEKIMPMIGAAARALVERHLGAGSLCAIVTATNSFITGPIARAFGVPHLIATEPEVKDGRFTGGVAGTPCFQAGKVERVREWLARDGLGLDSFAESWFYSDSANDLPLLERVSRPVAVDPDDRLRRVATERGWPILEIH